jgi:hypothetical protein
MMLFRYLLIAGLLFCSGASNVDAMISQKKKIRKSKFIYSTGKKEKKDFKNKLIIKKNKLQAMINNHYKLLNKTNQNNIDESGNDSDHALSNALKSRHLLQGNSEIDFVNKSYHISRNDDQLSNKSEGFLIKSPSYKSNPSFSEQSQQEIIFEEQSSQNESKKQQEEQIKNENFGNVNKEKEEKKKYRAGRSKYFRENRKKQNESQILTNELLRILDQMESEVKNQLKQQQQQQIIQADNNNLFQQQNIQIVNQQQQQIQQQQQQQQEIQNNEDESQNKLNEMKIEIKQQQQQESNLENTIIIMNKSDINQPQESMIKRIVLICIKAGALTLAGFILYQFVDLSSALNLLKVWLPGTTEVVKNNLITIWSSYPGSFTNLVNLYTELKCLFAVSIGLAVGELALICRFIKNDLLPLIKGNNKK